MNLGTLQASDIDVLRRPWHTDSSDDGDQIVQESVYSRENCRGTETGPVTVPGMGLVVGALPIARLLLPRLQSSICGSEETRQRLAARWGCQ